MILDAPQAAYAATAEVIRAFTSDVTVRELAAAVKENTEHETRNAARGECWFSHLSVIDEPFLEVITEALHVVL